MNRRRPKLALAVGLTIALLPLSPARACSCAFGDPRDSLDNADAAFIGTHISQRPVNPDKPHLDAIYTFHVDEEIKGTFDETVEVRSATQESACALGVTPGMQTGLLLYARDNGVWQSSSCSQMTPEQMREAASPLPEPTGSAPARYLIGGSFHDNESASVDPEGRVVAYGEPSEGPENEGSEMSVCPGSERVVEFGDHDQRRLVVRNIETLDVVDELRLPFGEGDLRRMHVSALSCRDRGGTDVYVFASDWNYRSLAEANSQVGHIANGTYSTIAEGTGLHASFDGRFAYVNSGRHGRRLVRVALGSGRERSLVRMPPNTGPMAASPDGTLLAGVSQGPDDYDRRRSAAVLVRLGDEPELLLRRIRRDYVSAEMSWLGDRRVAMLAHYDRRVSRIYDARLRTVRKLEGWSATDSVVDGDRVVGVAFDYRCYCGVMRQMPLAGGEITRLAELPTPVLHTLELVPDP